jgi:predicted HAD superfamily Cof-like phosphohydrolase
MKKQINQVKLFQESFNGIVNERPTLLSDREYALRHSLQQEELDEYLEACRSNDIVEIADAIADQLFLILGTAISHGLHNVIEDVFDVVVGSNMSKLDDNGNPIYNEFGSYYYDSNKPIGKILKSKNFYSPTKKIESLISEL